MNKKAKLAMNIAVVILFVYLYTKLDYQEILINLKAVPVTVLVALFALQIVDMLLVNYQNQRLSKRLGHPMSFYKMNFITSIGHVFDAITPGGGVGGEAVKIMMLKKHADVPISTGTAVVLSQKTISGCALLVFCICAFFYVTLTSSLGMPLSLKIAIYVGLISLLFLMIYVFYHPRKFINKCEKIKREKVRAPIINFLEGIEQIGADKNECMKQIFISFFIWFIYPFKLYLLLFVTNVQINFLSIYAIIFLSYGTAMIPIFPGGMLGFEVSMTSLLTIYGVAADKGLFITTLFRIVTFWFVIAVSLLYMGTYKLGTVFFQPSHRNLK